MEQREKDYLFNEALERHGDYIKQLIFTYVKDLQKTEDLTQDVFLKFYLSLAKFEGRSSIKTYLYRIAVNESQNYLRSWHYRTMRVTERLQMIRTFHSAEADFLQKEQHKEFDRLLNRLSVKYREVIWLHYYTDMPVHEISLVLNCSVNTVKTRLARGRNVLKKSLESGEMRYEH